MGRVSQQSRPYRSGDTLQWTTPTYDALGRTTIVTAPDAAGNQVRALTAGGASQRFQYDAANRLVKVKADDNVTVLATYTYGDSNERLIAEEGGLRTYYACDASTEYTESGSSIIPTWSKTYIYLGARLLSTLTPNGSGGEAVQHHHPDRLGTRLVTDPSSGTFFEQVSLPFGTALNAESTGSTNRRFTSYDRSSATGLDYAINRHYDSQQGRFTQVDPIGMQAASLTDPQSLNMYSYCGDDPVNRIDSNGLFWGKLWRAIKKIVTSKWFQIALAVAIIVIAHYYPGSIFGLGGGSTAAHTGTAPVLHAALTGAAREAAKLAAAHAIGVAALEGAVATSGIASAVSLGLAGALAMGLGSELGQEHTGKASDNKPGGGKLQCPGFARKFFDTTLTVLQSVASALDVAPILIITHASFESGWLDAHNRALNNLFGYTHAGGLNQRFTSLQAAGDAYINHTGPIIRGSKTADEFLGNLGKAHYNKDMVKYGGRFKARLEDVKRFGNGCGVLAP